MRFLSDGHARLLLRESEMSDVTSWKNPQFRTTSEMHPSGSYGLTELTELEMGDVSGAGTGLVGTFGCCWCVPWYSGWTVCGIVCNHPGCH